MACDPNFYTDALLLNLDADFSDASQNAFTVTPVGASIYPIGAKFGSGCAELTSTGYFSAPVTSGAGQLQHTDFTVEGWFLTTVTTSGIRTIFSSGNLTGGSGFRLTLNTSGTSTAYIEFEPIAEGYGWTSFYSGFDTTSGTWADGNWHAFALVRYGDTVTVYVDGVAVGNCPSLAAACVVVAPVPMPVSSTMTFGWDGLTAQSNYFNGFLDEIRVSNFARYTANYTPAVAAFPSTACTPSCDPNWADVSLLITGNSPAGSGTFVDSSSNNFTVSGGGTTEATASNPLFGVPTVSVGTVGLTVPITAGGPLDLANVANWTIEGWVLTETTSTGSFPITAGQYQTGSSGGAGLFIEAIAGIENAAWVFGDGALYVGSGGANIGLSASGHWYWGQWAHIAIVNDNNVLTCYLNGVGGAPQNISSYTSQPSWSAGGAGVFCMGGYPSSTGGQLFPGQVSQYRVTKGVARYTSNFTPSPLPFGLSCATFVPNVVGMQDAAAQATLTAAGFTVGTVTTENNAAAIGSVVTQSPVGGLSVTLPVTVNLVESLGLPVPDLTNQSIPVATTTLTAADFILGTQTVVPSGIVLAGNIISQSPTGGTYAAGGTPVNVVVSGGLPPLTVPDLFGMTESDAEALLLSLGLVPGAISSAPSLFVAPGEVQAQNPSAGPAVAVGTIVSFVLSSGVPESSTLFDFEATVISQYANSPTIMQLASNLNQYIDQSANFAAFYNYVWNIATAQGFGLDIWGVIVNVSRLLLIPNTNDYVGFYQPTESQPDQDWQPMAGDAPPYVGGQMWTGYNATEAYLLPDDAYRQLILAKAFANICTTTAPAINQILQNLYGPGTAYVLNTGPMSISYNLTFTPTAIQLAILQQSGVIPTPPGVAWVINTDV